MRRIPLVIVMIVITAFTAAAAEPFRPDEAMAARIAKQFRYTLDTAGINGVGRDILRCYDDNVAAPSRMRECVVDDVAASIMDGVITKIFIARGLDGSPAPLYRPQVFSARQDTYGNVAFMGDPQGRSRVGPAAQRVFELVMPK